MDNIELDDEYKNCWNANIFFPAEELNSYFDEAMCVGAHDQYSSSPDGGHDESSPPNANYASSKNILSERNRRMKLTERLHALRAVVPKITKMDRASIIKDAIEYIQSLHDEERRIQAEISELESGRQISPNSSEVFYLDQDIHSTTTFSSSASNNYQKRTRLMDNYYAHSSAPSSTLIIPSSPIQLLELRVTSMGERTIVVSLTCSKGTDTMVKLCEIFESLNLKIITANITAFSGRLLKTVFLEKQKCCCILTFMRWL